MSTITSDLQRYERLVEPLSDYEMSYLQGEISVYDYNDDDYSQSLSTEDMIILFGDETNVLEEAGIHNLNNTDPRDREAAYELALGRLGFSIH